MEEKIKVKKEEFKASFAYAAPGFKFRNLAIPQNITIDSITSIVCNKFSVAKKNLISTSRFRPIVLPRMIIMYLCLKRIPKITLKQIGDYFGKRDHTTVINAKKVIQNLIDSDAELRKVVDDLDREIW